MDDNTIFPGAQNVTGQVPLTGPTAPAQDPNIQPAMQPGQNPPAPQSLSGPRITLTDLYGPSNPQELQSPQQVPSAIQNHPIPQQVLQPVEQPPVQHEIPQQQLDTSIHQPLAAVPAQTEAPDMPAQQIDLTPFARSTDTGQADASLEEPVHGGGGFHFPSFVKFVIGGIIVLLLLLLVWGIGSFIFSHSSSNGKVNLTYWGLWENSSVFESVLADFQKQHPNITVTYTEEDPKDYTRRLLTRIQDGNGPDIFRMHNTWVFPLQSILLPLPSQVIDAKDLRTNYPPVVSQDMTNSGAIYGLPLQMDNLSLFVNTDIFTHAGASVPTTWDNFITTAKALTVKDPDGHIQTSGAAIGTYDNVEHAADIVSLLLLQNGADVQKLKGSQNATDALSFYTSFAQPDGSVWDSTLDNSLLAFERGKVAMYFGYSYDIFAIQASNPNLHFTVHPVPHLPGRTITVASYWVEGVSNKSKHPKEALELMQYLAQKDTQEKLYTQEAKTRSFGELYARTDLATQLSANPLLASFVSQFNSAQSSFFVGDTYYDEYNGALDQYLANAINSVLKDTSVDSAMDTLSQGVAQVLSQYAPKSP